MALRLTGSLWQQLVGSGVIPSLPTADSAKKSQLRQNPTDSQHRGSIWHRCGSLWRFFGFHVLQDSFPIKSSENILITILSAQIKPLNMERLFSIPVANR